MKCPSCKKKVIHLVLDWFVCKGRQCGQLWTKDQIENIPTKPISFVGIDR